MNTSHDLRLTLFYYESTFEFKVNHMKILFINSGRKYEGRELKLLNEIIQFRD